ncbi:MAG: hypothetical protein Q8880_00110 [Bacteroidota bacterium]|nr:hypothetical protein [Bacteroidota bacterium]
MFADLGDYAKPQLRYPEKPEHNPASHSHRSGSSNAYSINYN